MKTLVERLLANKDDRGLMASLRCALIAGKRHRAWPALNRLGVNIDREVDVFVAGMFAAHPEVTDKGNFGSLCKLIELRRDGSGNKDARLTPTERRFQHVLAASRDEVMERVLRLVLMAKAEGLSVNYGQLQKDLRFWNERIKAAWASAFWNPGADKASEEDA
jgi:CRISPR system Cascade subunit CasB